MAAKHKTKTGRKRNNPGVTVANRREQVQELYRDLDEWEKQQAPPMIAEIVSKYDGYSETNAKLIAMQRPDATDVDSRKAWIERGYIPRGKNIAIYIVAPDRVKYIEHTHEGFADDEEIEHRGYHRTPVYDVSNVVEIEERNSDGNGN